MRWLILFGLWAAYMTFGAVASSLAPLVPIIQADLNISYSEMGSILGSWQVIYIFSAIPAGVLLDRIGAKSALLIGLGLIIASAFGRAISENYLMLMASVMLFGLGGPIISSGAPKVVTNLFNGNERGLAMGIYMTGPILGGIACLTLTHSILLPTLGNDWRNVMLLWSGLTGLISIIWILISSLPGTNLPGLKTMEPISHDEHADFTTTIRKIIKDPAVKLLLLMAIGAFSINHGLNNWLPAILRDHGRSLIDASYWAALPMVIGIFSSLIIPRLATPQRRFKILVGLCISAALAALALVGSGDTSLLISLVMQGFVRASLMTVLILTLMELPSIKTSEAGTASGLFFSAAEIGGVLGPLSLGILYDFTGDFSAGLYGITAVATLMALGSIKLGKRNKA